MNDAPYLFKTAGRFELFWSAIPVAAKDPRERNGVEEVKVALGPDPPSADHAVQVRGAAVHAAFAHGRNPLHAEMALGMEVFGSRHRDGLRHSNKAPNGDSSAGRVAPKLRHFAWLDS